MMARHQSKHRPYPRQRRQRDRRGGGNYAQHMETARVAFENKRASEQSKCPSSWKDSFHTFARKTSDVVGHPFSFALAIVTIVGWAAVGPFFGFSDTWQLVINTATTIVTFLMVFLIQNTQNRDGKAIHLKLDELLHAGRRARNRLIHLEDLSEEELNSLQKEFERVRMKAAGPARKKNEGEPS